MQRIYTTLLYTAFAAFSLNALAEGASADQLAQAEKIFKRSCATCHGKSGEKPAMGESRIINTLNSDEIYTALSDRKNGKVEGGAGNMAKSRLSDEEMKALSQFVPTLKK